MDSGLSRTLESRELKKCCNQAVVSTQNVHSQIRNTVAQELNNFPLFKVLSGILWRGLTLSSSSVY